MERLVSNSAKSQSSMNAHNTVFDTKLLIERKITDPSVQSEMKHWYMKVVSRPGGKLIIEVNTKGWAEAIQGWININDGLNEDERNLQSLTWKRGEKCRSHYTRVLQWQSETGDKGCWIYFRPKCSSNYQWASCSRSWLWSWQEGRRIMFWFLTWEVEYLMCLFLPSKRESLKLRQRLGTLTTHISKRNVDEVLLVRGYTRISNIYYPLTDFFNGKDLWIELLT